MDDDEVIPSIPSDFWLKGCKTRCLLACMVHRTNKEIASSVASLNPAQSREIQCNNATARITAERHTACKTRKRESDDETHKRIQNQIGHMSIIKAQNDIVSTQLCLYNENRDAFVAAMGEAEYNNKIIELLKKLPEPQGSRDNVNRESNEDGEENDNSDDKED